MAIFHAPNVPLGRATKRLLEEMIQKDQEAGGGKEFQLGDFDVHPEWLKEIEQMLAQRPAFVSRPDMANRKILNDLVGQNIVEKKGDGTYCLTAEGRQSSITLD